jgi:hypothetical protein
MAYDKGRPLALDYPPRTIKALSEERLDYLFNAALSRGDTEAEALFGRELGRRTGTTRIQPAWYRTGKKPLPRFDVSYSNKPALPPGTKRG